MKNPRIYIDQPFALGQTVILTDNAANHIARVLRMGVDEQIRVFSNNVEYQARIVSAERKQVSVVLESEIHSERTSPLRTTIGLAMSKGDRMEYAIQKACELGVSHIVPLTSERSELRLKDDRADKKQQQWQQIAISACEQCGLNAVPSIGAIQSVSEFCQSADSELKFVLHHRTEKSLHDIAKPQSVTCLIGPEGGLSADEISLAELHGFKPLCLGPRVLRTETAPVAVLSLMQWLWGDWQ